MDPITNADWDALLRILCLLIEWHVTHKSFPRISPGKTVPRPTQKEVRYTLTYCEDTSTGSVGECTLYLHDHQTGRCVVFVCKADHINWYLKEPVSVGGTSRLEIREGGVIETLDRCPIAHQIGLRIRAYKRAVEDYLSTRRAERAQDAIT